MWCGLEIGLAIFGLIALIRGKMTLSKTKVVVGAPARLIGLLALAPLPIVFGFGIVFGIVKAAEGADPQQIAKDNQALFTGIEIGVVILTAILVFTIGAAVAISPQEAARRERAGRYDDDDYEDDDYEDARPRRRRDDRDDDNDDEDERPRRRRDDPEDDERPRRY